MIKGKKFELEKLETERKFEIFQETQINNKNNKNSKSKKSNKYSDYSNGKFDKKNYLKFFKLYLYKYMSLELIIPTLEKLNCKIYNVKNIFSHRASNSIYIKNSGLFLENLKYD